MFSAQKDSATSARDLRIDFFRGAALYMILFDHVGGDPISQFTYQRFGFSDAAELFVFLSGVSCGIVYPRVLQRYGWHGLFVSVAKRAALIYIYYLAASIAIIALIVAAESATSVSFDGQSMVTLHQDPVSAVISTINLTSPPDLPGILVLYLMLTLIAIPLFLGASQFNAYAALAISAAIWMISQFYPNLSPHLANHSYLALLSWQFLFSIGMFFGLRYSFKAQPLLSTQMRKLALPIAWTIVVASFGYRALRHFIVNYQSVADWFLASSSFSHMKENLSALRLVHFLSVAWLIATYVSNTNPLLKKTAANLIIQTGKNSLEIFCLSAILSVGLNILVTVYHPSVFVKLTVDGAVVALIAVTAMALSRRRRGRQKVFAPELAKTV